MGLINYFGKVTDSSIFTIGGVVTSGGVGL